MQTNIIGYEYEELLKTALTETEARLKGKQTPKERVDTLIEHMLILKELADLNY